MKPVRRPASSARSGTKAPGRVSVTFERTPGIKKLKVKVGFKGKGDA